MNRLFVGLAGVFITLALAPSAYSHDGHHGSESLVDGHLFSLDHAGWLAAGIAGLVFLVPIRRRARERRQS